MSTSLLSKILLRLIYSIEKLSSLYNYKLTSLRSLGAFIYLDHLLTSLNLSDKLQDCLVVLVLILSTGYIG